MRGYHDSSYGDSFADVYDDWYADLTDVGATVGTLGHLAARSGGRRVLELGVGTGRIAVPLAAAGLDVHGIDSSQLMLSTMAAKPGGDSVVAHLGDMVDGLPSGSFDVVFVAYNTFFSLLTDERQRACFRSVAARLTPEGRFVIEAFVPSSDPHRTNDVAVRTLAADRVVLSVSTTDATTQRAEGQYVEFTEAGGVRLRPWSIRWATPSQIDEMATAAGLHLVDRWESFDRTPFGVESPTHVSVYSPSGGSRLSML